jgi:hypothetical protein
MFGPPSGLRYLLFVLIHIAEFMTCYKTYITSKKPVNNIYGKTWSHYNDNRAQSVAIYSRLNEDLETRNCAKKDLKAENKNW